MISQLFMDLNIKTLRYYKNKFIKAIHFSEKLYNLQYAITKRKLWSYLFHINEIDILLYDFIGFLNLAKYKYTSYESFYVKPIYEKKNNNIILVSVTCRYTLDTTIIEIRCIYQNSISPLSLSYKVLTKHGMVLYADSEKIDNKIKNTLKEKIFDECIRIYSLRLKL